MINNKPEKVTAQVLTLQCNNPLSTCSIGSCIPYGNDQATEDDPNYNTCYNEYDVNPHCYEWYTANNITKDSPQYGAYSDAFINSDSGKCYGARNAGMHASWPSGIGGVINFGNWSNAANQNFVRVCSFLKVIKKLGIINTVDEFGCNPNN